MKKLFVFLGIISLLFATPTLKVSLTDGGSSYKGNAEMSFVCDNQKIMFSCSSAVCTNNGWFDSTSRCFDKTDGHFEFKTDKNPSAVSSEMLYLYDNYNSGSKNQYDYYDMELGTNGKIGSKYSSSGCCAGTVLLGLIGLGIYRKFNY